MPNHVTTRVKAPAQVIQALLNEKGEIDFGMVIPWDGSFPWNGVSGAAETCAEAVLNKPLNEHGLIASLQAESRRRADVSALDDEDFEQFVQMLRNHRQTGYLHQMDFARAKWGTKWNAYSQAVNLEAQEAKFDTAWSCPIPVLTKLSSAFPVALIEVQFADEDIGSNCGTIHLTAGEEVLRDVAGRWAEMNQQEREKWQAFAYQVKGWSPESDDD